MMLSLTWFGSCGCAYNTSAMQACLRDGKSVDHFRSYIVCSGTRMVDRSTFVLDNGEARGFIESLKGLV